jgi:threonine dehydrogenase-like Zn-dependent dehydrogenase
MLGSNVPALGAGIVGRSVLVVGAGIVGMLVALFAQTAGASEIIVADRSAFRRLRATCLGFVVTTEDEAWEQAKARWHHGGDDRGADIVFQTRADSASLHNAFRALRPQGAVIDLAFYQAGAERLRLGEEFHHNGLSLRCAQINRVPRGLGFYWNRRRLAAETVKLLKTRGKEIKAQLFTHIVPFDNAPAFLADLIAARPEFLQIVFKVAS